MSMGTTNNTENSSNSLSDNMALTDTQLVEYAVMNPFIIYLDGGDRVKNKSVVAALLEGVRPATANSPNSIKVRKHGVRKGELGYNAKACITSRKLVPVFALVEERLVDEMRVSPAALAMGMACLRPDLRDLVDCLVEEYVEAAPIEREFFNPTEGADTQSLEADVTTAGTISFTLTDCIIKVADEGVLPSSQEQLLTLYTENNSDGNYIPASHDVLVYTGLGSEPSLSASSKGGVVADGEFLDFDPELHVIP